MTRAARLALVGLLTPLALAAATPAQAQDAAPRCGEPQTSTLEGTEPPIAASLVVCARSSAPGVLEVSGTATLTSPSPVPAGVFDSLAISISVTPVTGEPVRKDCDVLPQVDAPDWTSRELPCVVTTTASDGQYTPTAQLVYALVSTPPAAAAATESAPAASGTMPGGPPPAGPGGDVAAQADDAAPAASSGSGRPVPALLLVSAVAGLLVAGLDRARHRRRAHGALA